ncbi:uncharacterized protein [Henckelia pumila]|uniref:uncharacterized protein n=1 Tax=Henckelia pumila TaxID=405737 RepID=UPI003C6DD376
MAEGVDNRTVLDLIRPPIVGYGSSIVRPAVEANSFELKPSIIQMIQLQARFGGTSMEDPYSHLERFLSICNTIKFNRVTSDAVRLRLFPFSLQGDALDWLDDLPTEGEFLHETWTRFKKMLRMCPQKNLTQNQQTQTFYNGADPSVRSMLDAAASGCLFRKTPAKAWEIIGNMEESNIGWPDVKKENQSGVLEVDDLMALNAKIGALTHQVALMKTALVNQIQGHKPEEQQLFEVKVANFSGNQGRQPYNSYNNTYSQNWQSQPKQEVQKPRFEEIMMKYVAGTETRLKNQEAMLQRLETQMAHIATQLSTRPEGSLPSNTEPNPRGVNVIMVVTRAQSEEQQRDEENTMEGPKNSDSKKDVRAKNSSTADALAQMPNYAKFLKDLLRNKKKLNDVMQVQLSEGIDPLQNIYRGEACSCKIDLSFSKMVDKPP